MTRGAATQTIPRRVGIVLGFLALAAVPALGLSAFAAADTGTGEPSGQPAAPRTRPALTGAQEQCLVDHGVTLPVRLAVGDPGQPPTPPTVQQREAFQLAAQACGLPTPALGDHWRGGFGFGTRPRLTAAQRQCVVDHGVTLPPRPATGEPGARPTLPSGEQRAALQQAAAACGITIPGPHVVGGTQDAAV